MVFAFRFKAAKQLACTYYGFCRIPMAGLFCPRGFVALHQLLRQPQLSSIRCFIRRRRSRTSSTTRSCSDAHVCSVPHGLWGPHSASMIPGGSLAASMRCCMCAYSPICVQVLVDTFQQEHSFQGLDLAMALLSHRLIPSHELPLERCQGFRETVSTLSLRFDLEAYRKRLGMPK